MWFEITYISCGAIFLIYLCNRFKIDLKANADSIIYFLVPAFFLIIYDKHYSVRELLAGTFLMVSFFFQHTGFAYETGMENIYACADGICSGSWILYY